MSADSEGAIPSEALRESEVDGAASAPPGSLISWLIDWSLRNRFLVACGTLLIIAWGIWAVRHTPVDAIPDLSENQVIVFADWAGRSPQEVEDQVTYPLSTNLQGLAGVKEVRATSMFGFSLLTVIFDDKIDNYFARTRVLERLNFLQRCCPPVSRRSSDPTPPGSAGFTSTISKPIRLRAPEPARMRPRVVLISGRCARCRISFSATSSLPSKAWPRSPASAALSGNIKSRWTPGRCGKPM